jgi:GntR family transcriptional regulator/MocR family aminotransferase
VLIPLDQRELLSKAVSSFDLALNHKPPHQTLTSWLYGELRGAILEGRLGPGTRLPASRDFARLHRLSRGTVMNAFERLQAEGYLSSRVGSGTWVNHRVAAGDSVRGSDLTPPTYVRRVISAYTRPKAFVRLVATDSARPFRMRDPALAEFPAKLWGRLAARRAGISSVARSDCLLFGLVPWCEVRRGSGDRGFRSTTGAGS